MKNLMMYVMLGLLAGLILSCSSVPNGPKDLSPLSNLDTCKQPPTDGPLLNRQPDVQEFAEPDVVADQMAVREFAPTPSSKITAGNLGLGDAQAQPTFNTEDYSKITDNAFQTVKDNPVSTFSIDVDTASYSNLRRFLNGGQKPPVDAIRIEELVNYFPYNYKAPQGQDIVAIQADLSTAPWNKAHQLLRLGLKAKEVPTKDLPPSNLVFLLDTSGSMGDENKLPLLKKSLGILVEQLRPQDRVSIVAYAGSAGLVLEPTSGSNKQAILAAMDQLESGGSTAGGAGIQLAYKTAKDAFLKNGNNRVILCTDGDFNVGVSSDSELERLIEEKRRDNIYLTVLGFGMGNYKDNKMETLADKGNGNYAYIDNLLEAKKVLGKEVWGNIFTLAKDVKLQLEFNPLFVQEYRLIGYENRLLNREDFNDDTKDAGEMGSGQTVTAFYEIVPADAASATTAKADPLVFQETKLLPSSDFLALRMRYKDPAQTTSAGADAPSRLTEFRLQQKDIQKPFAQTPDDFRFASAVIEFGMLLRDSPFRADSNWSSLLERARGAKGPDVGGYRAEFLQLAEAASRL